MTTPYDGQPPQEPNPYGQNPPPPNPYVQNPYGQNPYGQAPPPPNPYGQAPYGAPYGQNPYGHPGYPPPQQDPGFNGFAIAGFVLAFLCSLLGLIFSCIALSQISSRGQRGRGLAIAGVIISIVSMVGGVLIYANK